MVSTYSRRSTAELTRIKARLLARVTEASENPDRVCAHLDAVERELQRRTAAEVITLQRVDNGYEAVVRGGVTLGYVRWVGKGWDGYRVIGLHMENLGFWPREEDAISIAARHYD
ncbi:MAG: hypothetical protein ACTHQE_10050, partial [Thermomicrobiales bacterium]